MYSNPSLLSHPIYTHICIYITATHRKKLRSIVFNPQAPKFFATTSLDGSVALWELTPDWYTLTISSFPPSHSSIQFVVKCSRSIVSIILIREPRRQDIPKIWYLLLNILRKTTHFSHVWLGVESYRRGVCCVLPSRKRAWRGGTPDSACQYHRGRSASTIPTEQPPHETAHPDSIPAGIPYTLPHHLTRPFSCKSLFPFLFFSLSFLIASFS